MCGRDKESIVDNGRLLIRASLAGKDGVPVRTWLVQLLACAPCAPCRHPVLCGSDPSELVP